MLSRLSSIPSRLVRPAVPLSSPSSQRLFRSAVLSSCPSFSSSSHPLPNPPSRLLSPRSVPLVCPPPRSFSSVSTRSRTTEESFDPVSNLHAEHLAHYPETEVTTLSNGLRVASETSPYLDVDTATVGVWIDAGSRYEDEKTNGVAHFLEHMSFKGTSKRSRRELESSIENMGGHLNAYTSREQTVFFCKVLKKDVEAAMELLSDILTNSLIEEGAVEHERSTILQEMESVEKQVNEVIFDRLHQTAYRGSALGRTILGPPENIMAITKDDIKKYVQTHYTADRMVVAVAGNVRHDEVAKYANKYFAKVPSTPPAGLTPLKDAPLYTGSDILVRFDDMPKAHVAYGFATAGWSDPDNFPLMLIQTMLGSWTKNVHNGIHSSSHMVSEIAKYQVADMVQPFNTQYSDTGLFGVYAVADPQMLDCLMWTLTNTLTNFAVLVNPHRLEEAKNYLKASVIRHLDGTTSICEDIGRQMLTYGRRMHPSEVIARIDAVDEYAIRNCAQRYFFDRDHVLSAMGPIWELPDYNWIRARSYTYRF